MPTSKIERPKIERPKRRWQRRATARHAAAALSVAGLVLAATPVIIGAGGASAAPLQSKPDNGFKIDADDIGGVVTGPRGPEAGVWVVAETTDFDTRFAKMVVTDDKGKYVLPDLPEADYEVWVRGYGLRDSAKVDAGPGERLNLKALAARNPVEAAQYYPANWWLSLLEAPAVSEFPIGNFTNQAQWVWDAKSQIIRYQYGGPFHRGLYYANPKYASIGANSTFNMLRHIENAGQMPEFWPGRSDSVVAAYAKFIDKIWAGDTPPAPPRPSGIERNIVATTWDAGDEVAFMHDIIATDKRNPTVNANGNIYGGEFHNDKLAIVDVNDNSDTMIPMPYQVDEELIPTFTRQTGWTNPSPTYGGGIIIDDHARPNGITMDERGRVWNTAAVNTHTTPSWCKDPNNKYAAVDPTFTASPHINMYDPATQEWKMIHTCFGGQHATMSVDGSNRIFNNGGNSRFGWIEMDVVDAGGTQEESQGWCRLNYDSDGDGDGDREFPVNGSPYGPQQSMADGSVWGAVQSNPGKLVRLDLGDNPPETCVGEAYNVPFQAVTGMDPNVKSGFVPRGIDIDSEGVVWTGLAGSGHLASFDRRLCEGPLTGVAARAGDHCPEGWKLYATPGPRIKNTPFSADFHYYNFVDKFDVIGLGADTPLINGTNSDSLLAFDEESEKWTRFTLPYPVGGLFTRGMDVRMDDPSAGWKGTGLWATNGTRAVWFNEFGYGSRSLVAKFQLRPSPLAR